SDVARIQRLAALGVGVHHLGEEVLVEAAPVHPDADGLAVVDGHLDDGAEVVVVVLAPDIPGVDAVLGQGLRAVGILDEENVAVVVEVADDRHLHLAHDLRYRAGGRVVVHGHAHQLAARRVQRAHLGHRSRHVRGVGIGHGLDHDGPLAAHAHPAHVHHHALPPARTTHGGYLTITAACSRPPARRP